MQAKINVFFSLSRGSRGSSFAVLKWFVFLLRGSRSWFCYWQWGYVFFCFFGISLSIFSQIRFLTRKKNFLWENSSWNIYRKNFFLLGIEIRTLSYYPNVFFFIIFIQFHVNFFSKFFSHVFFFVLCISQERVLILCWTYYL